MRISDWSSDVCSSDLRSSRLASSWRTTSVHLTETTQGPSCRSNPSYVSSISAEPPECLEKRHWRSSRTIRASTDRKSVVSGKSVSVRVDLGGRRIIKKKKNMINNQKTHHKIEH